MKKNRPMRKPADAGNRYEDRVGRVGDADLTHLLVGPAPVLGVVVDAVRGDDRRDEDDLQLVEEREALVRYSALEIPRPIRPLTRR